jgi:hypothetical protein
VAATEAAVVRVSADKRHGTPSGYKRHQLDSEKPCDACARAKQEYDQRWRSSPEQTRRNRLHAKAQGRAHTRMRAIYPEVYAALYAEEKERAYREAGLYPEAVREW